MLPIDFNLAYNDYLMAFALTPSQALSKNILIAHVHSCTAVALGVQDSLQENPKVRSYTTFVSTIKTLEDGYGTNPASSPPQS